MTEVLFTMDDPRAMWGSCTRGERGQGCEGGGKGGGVAEAAGQRQAAQAGGLVQALSGGECAACT